MGFLAASDLGSVQFYIILVFVLYYFCPDTNLLLNYRSPIMINATIECIISAGLLVYKRILCTNELINYKYPVFDIFLTKCFNLN